MELDPRDRTWQVWRSVAAGGGILLFLIAGTMLLAAGEDLDDTSTALFRGLGLAAYGMAVVCFLAGSPSRLVRPSLAPRADVGCPDCERVLPHSMLAGHLVSAHGHTDEDARTLTAHAAR